MKMRTHIDIRPPKADRYDKELNRYINNLKGISTLDKLRLETQFESIRDWSLFCNVDEMFSWYNNKLDNVPMKVEEIPLKECKDWIITDDKIYHKTKEFFSIFGLRVDTKSREVDGGWDQPILQQVPYDGSTNGGILGIMRKRFQGVPHYLIESKFEPGNPNFVQLSPTFQATFSNINAIHLGNVPHYLDYFQNPEKYGTLHYKKWWAEDGGRFYFKSNLNILIEVDEEKVVPIENDNFIWMSMYQIKKCLDMDNWVNPHVRSIISYL